MKPSVPAIVFIVGIVLIGLGAFTYDDVTRSNNISSVVCLSCLGITNTDNDDLSIDDLTRVQYSSFTQDVTLYVFSQIDCRSCPKVVGMAKEIAKFYSSITAVEVKYDYDTELFRSLALQYDCNAESVGVPWIVIVNEQGAYESWLYESYLPEYPKDDDIRYVIQIIDKVIELGTA